MLRSDARFPALTLPSLENKRTSPALSTSPTRTPSRPSTTVSPVRDKSAPPINPLDTDVVPTSTAPSRASSNISLASAAPTTTPRSPEISNEPADRADSTETAPDISTVMDSPSSAPTMASPPTVGAVLVVGVWRTVIDLDAVTAPKEIFLEASANTVSVCDRRFWLARSPESAIKLMALLASMLPVVTDAPRTDTPPCAVVVPSCTLPAFACTSTDVADSIDPVLTPLSAERRTNSSVDTVEPSIAIEPLLELTSTRVPCAAPKVILPVVLTST